MIVKQVFPVYGNDLVKTLDPAAFDDCVVFHAPEAWAMVQDQFPKAPKADAVPVSMEFSLLEEQIRSLPKARVVFGIGGGSACDAAKMYASLHQVRLVLAPSILSVDAPFTSAVGIRVDHRVRYTGRVYPDPLLIDFNLLLQAPKKLNRAGIGDILSIYTALFDWKLAADSINEKYDAVLASKSQALFDRLIAGADDIRNCTEKGLRLLSELFVAEVGLCEQFGSSRPEEGSEHYFAYCLESITKRPYIHGELIGMAVLLTALYQGQPTEPIARFLDNVKVEFRPDQIGITPGQIEQTLLALPHYLKEETQLLYGIFHHNPPDAVKAKKIVETFLKIV